PVANAPACVALHTVPDNQDGPIVSRGLDLRLRESEVVLCGLHLDHQVTGVEVNDEVGQPERQICWLIGPRPAEPIEQRCPPCLRAAAHDHAAVNRRNSLPYRRAHSLPPCARVSTSVVLSLLIVGTYPSVEVGHEVRALQRRGPHFVLCDCTTPAGCPAMGRWGRCKVAIHAWRSPFRYAMTRSATSAVRPRSSSVANMCS